MPPAWFVDGLPELLRPDGLNCELLSVKITHALSPAIVDPTLKVIGQALDYFNDARVVRFLDVTLREIAPDDLPLPDFKSLIEDSSGDLVTSLKELRSGSFFWVCGFEF